MDQKKFLALVDRKIRSTRTANVIVGKKPYDLEEVAGRKWQTAISIDDVPGVAEVCAYITLDLADADIFLDDDDDVWPWDSKLIKSLLLKGNYEFPEKWRMAAKEHLEKRLKVNVDQEPSDHPPVTEIHAIIDYKHNAKWKLIIPKIVRTKTSVIVTIGYAVPLTCSIRYKEPTTSRYVTREALG